MLGTLVMIFLFGLATAAIAVYSAFELRMIFRYWRDRQTILARSSLARRGEGLSPAPTVSIQIPIYNEGATVVPLLRAVAAFDYPRDRMDIQVLDDSTDETSSIVAAEVERIKAAGLNVSHIRRENREGWKAGALNNALRFSDAEFVAIFDADFVPPAGYLRQTLIESAMFDDPKVAFVQGRWTYTNETQNVLTRAQAILLDRHFAVQKPYLMAKQGTTVFNGSGGVLRRAAIDSVGGWSWDTLCEDLDLSYRWALMGWIGVYDRSLESPSEIPYSMAAFKLQQRRWAKGSAQCMRKLAGDIVRSRRLTDRSDDLFVIFGYIIHPIVLLYSLIWPLAVTSELPREMLSAGQVILVLANLVALAGFLTTTAESDRRLNLTSIGTVVLAVQVGASLIVNNAIAFVLGCFERVSVFERTPKLRNAVRAKSSGPGWHVALEFAFIVYMLSAAALLYAGGNGSFALPCLGFGAATMFFFTYQFMTGPVTVKSAPAGAA